MTTEERLKMLDEAGFVPCPHENLFKFEALWLGHRFSLFLCWWTEELSDKNFLFLLRQSVSNQNMLEDFRGAAKAANPYESGRRVDALLSVCSISIDYSNRRKNGEYRYRYTFIDQDDTLIACNLYGSERYRGNGVFWVRMTIVGHEQDGHGRTTTLVSRISRIKPKPSAAENP